MKNHDQAHAIKAFCQVHAQFVQGNELHSILSRLSASEKTALKQKLQNKLNEIAGQDVNLKRLTLAFHEDKVKQGGVNDPRALAFVRNLWDLLQFLRTS